MKIEEFSKALKILIEKRGYEFIFEDMQITAGEVASLEVFLPLIIEKGREQSEKIFKKSNEMSYKINENSPIQMSPFTGSDISPLMLVYIDYLISSELKNELKMSELKIDKLKNNSENNKNNSKTIDLKKWTIDFEERYKNDKFKIYEGEIKSNDVVSKNNESGVEIVPNSNK